MAAMYGAFLLQAFALWLIGDRRLNGWYVGVLALLSIFSFSPAGHNNHWWSMMIQLHLEHLFLTAAFISIALKPTAWIYNLLASVFCWLAAYTLANGLIAFFVAATVSQLGAREPQRITNRTIFWIVNIATVFAVYLPGIPHETGGHPGPLTILWFAFVYLGFPLVSLIHYPYTAQFEVPVGLITTVNGIAGILLCTAALGLASRFRDQIQARTASAMCFIGFALFALGSAIITAWGRGAFDKYGVANANSSRYVLFSTYLVYGVLYLLMSRRVQEVMAPRRMRLAAATLVCFIGFAGYAYARSVNVYRQAHDFNRVLKAAYADRTGVMDTSIYPNAHIAAELKDGLRRLGIGPYYGAPLQDFPDDLQELASHSLEDTFHINGIRHDPVLGTILFAHPRSRFFLPVSSRIATATFIYGISGGALIVNPKTDGVEFRVLLEQNGAQPVSLWSRYLDPAKVPGDRDRQKVTLRFKAPDGSRLVFQTSPGPTYDADWAYWADVVLGNY
jgi:hypothetical protein